MKITYDKTADAVYIYFTEQYRQETAWVKKTYSCDPVQVNGMINLDFDEEGKLGGIEILDAQSKLPQSFLDSIEA